MAHEKKPQTAAQTVQAGLDKDRFVQEYVTLIDEGWEPEVEEFLTRVPDDIRGETEEGILAALARRELAGQPEPPEIEVEAELGEYEQLGIEIAEPPVDLDVDEMAEQFVDPEPVVAEEHEPIAVRTAADEMDTWLAAAEGESAEPEAAPAESPTAVLEDLDRVVHDVVDFVPDEVEPEPEPEIEAEAPAAGVPEPVRFDRPEPTLAVKKAADEPPPFWDSMTAPQAELDEPAVDEVAQTIEVVASSDEVDAEVADVDETLLDIAADAHAAEVAAEPVSTLAAGEPVIPGYRIEHLLGRGSLGETYAAWDEFLQRRVALKLCATRGAAASVERAYELAQQVAQLGDDTIVEYDAVAVGGDGPALVSSCVEGMPIDVICVEQNLAFTERARLLAIVARSLAAAHAANLHHGRLKPENIITTTSLAVRLLDFGTATIAPPLDRTGPATAVFAAPEELQHARSGPAADVFSFGAVMYAVLTGSVPFGGESAVALTESVVNHDPVFPRQLDPAIPDDLQQICLACLTRDPRLRPGMADVAADLARVHAGEPALLRPRIYRRMLGAAAHEKRNVRADFVHHGLLTPAECDGIEAMERGALQRELHWRFAERRVSLRDVATLAGALAAAAAAGVYVFAGLAAAPWLFVAPAAAAAALLGAAFQAWRRGDGIAAHALAGAGCVVTACAVFAGIEVAGYGIEAGRLAAGGALLATAGGAFAWMRTRYLAWLTAAAAVTAYAAALAWSGWVGAELAAWAFWLTPLALLAPFATLCESQDRAGWAVPFRVVALAGLVAGVPLAAIAGTLPAWLGLANLAPWCLPAAAAVAAHAAALLVVQAFTSNARSLDLRRSSRALEWVAPGLLLGGVAANALARGGWVDIVALSAATVFLLGVAPWRERRVYLAWGLVGLASLCAAPLALGLVGSAAYAMALGGLGLALSAGLTFARSLTSS